MRSTTTSPPSASRSTRFSEPTRSRSAPGLLEAVKRGLATDALLAELEREEARKGAIAPELARLADLERVDSLDAAQVSRTLTTLAADVRDVLAGVPGPARQMLRKLFAGHRIECRPFVEPDGTRGYHFRAEGSYAALLAGQRVVSDGRVPDGPRQVVARALTVPVRGIARAA